eukprot:2088229-Lingulodinium_polyedra.AAC.1
MAPREDDTLAHGVGLLAVIIELAPVAPGPGENPCFPPSVVCHAVPEGSILMVPDEELLGRLSSGQANDVIHHLPLGLQEALSSLHCGPEVVMLDNFLLLDRSPDSIQRPHLGNLF